MREKVLNRVSENFQYVYIYKEISYTVLWIITNKIANYNIMTSVS